MGATPADDQRAEGEQQRHQADVDEFQGRAEAFDVLVQLVLDITELPANPQLLLAELLDRVLLLGRENEGIAFGPLALQFGDLAFGLT